MSADALESTLGNGLRALRISRRLTQQELAERANVSLGALQHLERGEGATTGTLVKVVHALGADEWLAGLAPPPTPFNPLDLLERRRRDERQGRPRSRVRRPRPG